LVAETSSDERLLTELTSATQEPLRGDMLGTVALIIESLIASRCSERFRVGIIFARIVHANWELRLVKEGKMEGGAGEGFVQ
jgi:hypothetical protein